MRVVLDEDIPRSLTDAFRAEGHSIIHVEDLGLRGTHNSALLAAISGSADVLVTGDTNLGHQQNLKEFDLAVILVHPPRLVVDQILPLIPAVVAAYSTARKHAVTTVGRPRTPNRSALGSPGKPPATRPRKMPPGR